MTAQVIDLAGYRNHRSGTKRVRARKRAKIQFASTATRQEPRRDAGPAAAEMGSPTLRRRLLAREL